MQISIINGTLTGISETLSPSSGYTLPSSVSVTGATTSYNSSTGELILTSLSGTNVITASGEAQSTAIHKTYFGNKVVLNKYIGGKKVLKEILNGVTIYEYGDEPTPFSSTAMNFTNSNNNNETLTLNIYKEDTTANTILLDGAVVAETTTSGSQDIDVVVSSAGNHTIEITGSSFYFDGYCFGSYSLNSYIVQVFCGTNITSIDNGFSGCSNLTAIALGNSITSIGLFVFYNCSSLSSIIIPNSVTSIDNYAFGKCSSLTSITIPNSVTSIGGWAFDGCSGLSDFNYSGTMSEWANVTLGEQWRQNTSFKVVHCSDGDVEL